MKPLSGPAGVVVPIVVVRHVLAAADVPFVFAGPADLIIVRFDHGPLSVVLQITVVLFAFIAGICDDGPVTEGQFIFHLPEERLQRSCIRRMPGNGQPGDICGVHTDLQVVTGLELSIHHVIFLHPHEGGVRIGLGAAVALPALMDPVCVFFDLRQMLLQLFDVPLQLRLPFPGAMDELDAFLFPDRIEPFAKSLQVLEPDLSPPHRAQAIAVLAFLKERCDPVEPLCHVLRYRLLPYKGIPVRICLDLRPVDEDLFASDLADAFQEFGGQRQDARSTGGKVDAAEPGDRRMIRRRFSFQQVHEVDILLTGFFDAS